MIRTQESLKELMDSEEYHCYVSVAQDEKNPNMLWTILGDYNHNFLWIILRHQDTGVELIDTIISPVKNPPMSDREHGMRIEELEAIAEHSKLMKERYQKIIDQSCQKK